MLSIFFMGALSPAACNINLAHGTDQNKYWDAHQKTTADAADST